MNEKKLQVERASIADVPMLHKLGKMFYELGRMHEIAPWDTASFDQTLVNLLQLSHNAVFVAKSEDGMVHGISAMTMFPVFFNSSCLVAQEIFLFVEPSWRFGSGNSLLESMEQTGREGGAKIFIAGALAELRGEAVARLYFRRGYKIMSNSFVKLLDDDEGSA